jgi:hypothetical protein
MPAQIRKMVGAPGFEPGTSCAQGRRATKLRYAPTARQNIPANTTCRNANLSAACCRLKQSKNAR